jgi:hypothetical protein
MAVNLSISDLAAEFGMTRDTVRKRLGAANVRPAAERRGHHVYRLRDALGALLGDGSDDPERLDPFRRKAHFQAEKEKLHLDVERGELVPRPEVEDYYARAFKPIGVFLETLPDALERDAGLTPAQIERTERLLDGLREQLHANVLEAVDARARR